MNVFTDTIQFRFIANNAFPIVALPQFCPWCASYCIDPFGDRRFESRHHSAERIWCWTRRGDRPVACSGEPLVTCSGDPRYGRPAGRPNRICNQQNAVEMIRHHDPCIQFNFIAYFRGLDPLIGNNQTCTVQLHCAVGNVAEPTLPIVGTDGYEIGTRARIIVVTQTDRTTFFQLNPRGRGPPIIRA